MNVDEEKVLVKGVLGDLWYWGLWVEQSASSFGAWTWWAWEGGLARVFIAGSSVMVTWDTGDGTRNGSPFDLGNPDLVCGVVREVGRRLG